MTVVARAMPWLLCLYVVALATSMSGMELFSGLLCLGLLIDPEGRRRVFSRPPAFWKPLLSFSLVIAIGILLGGASDSEKRFDLSRLRFFFIYVGLFHVVALYGRERRWLSFLVGITALIGVYGTVQHFVAIDLFRPVGKKVLLYALQNEKIGPLVVGTFNHHLTFASIFLIYACLFSALGLSGLRRWALPLGLWLFLLCFWTQSRTAWCTIPVVVTLLAWARSRRLMWVSLAGIIVLMMGLYVFDPGFKGRLTHTLQKDHGDDLYLLGPRQRLWISQLYMFKEHPIVGIGWNNNERRAKEYVDHYFPDNPKDIYGHAHSTPLQILSTTGILGFAAYVWLWVAILLTCWKVAASARGELKWWGWGLLAGFTGFLLQGLTQWNFGDAEVLHNVVFFWAVAANLDVVDMAGRSYN